MSFLLRAALVIGALTYLALLRQDAAAPGRLATAAAGATMDEAVDRLTTGGIGALVNALPPETREDMARAGAEALARHLAGPPKPRPSADTLSASDRQPSWRGSAPR